MNNIRLTVLFCLFTSTNVACTPLRGNFVQYPEEEEKQLVSSAVTPKQAPLPRWAIVPPLSPGDRLLIDIEDGTGFSGRYEIGMDGALRLPQLPPLLLAGLSTEGAKREITKALVAANLFRANRIRVSVLVHEWSQAQVYVSGAVFNPGMVTINALSSEQRELKNNVLAGDYPAERMLSTALRAAGGVHPGAAVERIVVTRANKSVIVNYSGLLAGLPIPMIPLMSGDSISVPDSGTFNRNLVKRSKITPPGIRVFLSPSDAGTLIDKDAYSLPYGSRLLNAAISAKCAGGFNNTNAARHVVLVRAHPITGATQALRRPVNKLIRNAHSDDINPHLMPHDSVVCFDSAVSNLREIARTLSAILLPFELL